MIFKSAKIRQLDFNYFSIMFYYIFSTTYQKIGNLFCPVIFLDFRTVCLGPSSVLYSMLWLIVRFVVDSGLVIYSIKNFITYRGDAKNFRQARPSYHSAPHRCRTQGVLASKFPISILTWTQGQHRCQTIRKIPKNHVPVSDFATRQLNLRKLQNSQNICKKYIFFFS